MRKTKKNTAHAKRTYRKKVEKEELFREYGPDVAQETIRSIYRARVVVCGQRRCCCVAVSTRLDAAQTKITSFIVSVTS